MRLTEFLQPAPVVAPPTMGVREVPIPMWVLEGSDADYEAFLVKRRLNTIASTLTEAAIDRYRPMLEVFRKIDGMSPTNTISGNSWHDIATKQLNWAMTVLKREDRIVWFLRLLKVMYLGMIASKPVADGPQQAEIINFINKEYARAKAGVNKAIGGKVDDDAVYAAEQIKNLNQFQTDMEHFMSMDIPQIQQTTWGPQLPRDLMQSFRAIEKEWSARRSSVVDMSQDDKSEVTTIIEFPDGSAWVNLNRSSCSLEADAMGHCGNTASNRSYETVLSYRTPVNEHGRPRDPKDGGTHWRPRLTFILHKETGMLGEMKGRANNKPKDELHPFIIALLRSDLVKGITGGGYAPENNFEMSDLDPEVAAALIKEKPALGTVSQHFAVEGRSESLMNRVQGILDQYEVSNNGFTEDGKYLIIDTHNDFADFAERWGSRTETYIAGIMSGSDSMYDGDYHSGDRSDRESLLEDLVKLRPDILEHLKAYMKWTYPEQFGIKSQDDDQQDDDQNDDDQDDDYGDDAEYDIDDLGDIVRCLEDESDDLYDQIGNAISDGHRSGAESEMYEAFWKWLDDPFEGHGTAIIVDEKNKYDSKVYTVLPFDELIGFLPPEDDEFVETVSGSGWSEWLEVNKIDEPYYGWSGYDEHVALENLGDHFDIPDVPDYEIPVAGNANIKDRDAIYQAIQELGGEEIPNTKARSKNWKTPEGIRVLDIDAMNGVIVMNVYFNAGDKSTEEMAATYATFLRFLAMVGRSRGCSIVLRTHEKHLMKHDLVGETGFTQAKHGYLRYDPPKAVKESDEPVRIKLRGRAVRDSDGDVDGFLHDLEQATQEHPWNHKMRIFGSVGIEVSPWGTGIHLGDIVTLGDARQGHGTNALKLLTQLADQHGVTISGVAKAYSNKPGHIQGTSRLLKWYQKHGFKRTGGYPEDGYDIEYKPRAVTEAPIDDYGLIGNWGDNVKSNSFMNPQDRKIIQSPNLIQKVRRKFGNTEHMLNFYFVNLPGVRQFAETGVKSEEEIAKDMPEAWAAIRQRETDRGTDRTNAINVLYVGNAGVNRVPMTAWIMGHRLGHAVQASNRGGKNKIHSWADLEREFSDMLGRMMDEVYGWNIKKQSRFGAYGAAPEPDMWNHPDIAKFLEAIGTMASARNGKLGGRPYEFMYEMFSQYLTTGELKFRDLPKVFGRPRSQRRSRDEEMRDMYSRDLNGWFADHITSYMDNVCYECTGKYLVM